MHGPAPTLAEMRAGVAPVLQAAFLVAALLAALHTTPGPAQSLLVAAIVLSMALLDPWITGVRVSLLSVAHRTTSLAFSRSAAWAFVLATSVTIAVICAGTIVAVSPAVDLPWASTRAAAEASVRFGVPAALSSLLMAFGSRWGPLVPAVAACVAGLAAVMAHPVWALAVALVCMVVSLARTIHHFTDARVFA